MKNDNNKFRYLFYGIAYTGLGLFLLLGGIFSGILYFTCVCCFFSLIPLLEGYLDFKKYYKLKKENEEKK